MKGRVEIAQGRVGKGRVGQGLNNRSATLDSGFESFLVVLSKA